MTISALPRTPAIPVVLPGARAAFWLFGGAVFGLLLYYFVGVDQGAVSVLGHNNMYFHEFFHDGRHFFGFPCH